MNEEINAKKCPYLKQTNSWVENVNCHEPQTTNEVNQAALGNHSHLR